MNKREIVILLVIAAAICGFAVAMMTDHYVIAVAFILIPAVGTGFYTLGKAHLPRRRKSSPQDY